MHPDIGSFPFTDENGTIWLAFTEWGDLGNDKVVICVHGLTRQGRDFDELARALSEDFRVISVDVAGRGRSGWLADKTAYNYDTYMRHMDGMLDYRGLTSVDWIGTSMGGMMGMLMAARPDTPIRRLVVNDIGPFIPKEALERIGSYVGGAPSFPNLQAAGAYFRYVHSAFGELTDLQWSDMTVHSVHREANGSYNLHYDPAIADAFAGPINDLNLWPVYDKIDMPTLVLRGATSDLLSADTARQMTQRGPWAELVEFPDCGHAPALMDEVQIQAVHDWLLTDHFDENVDEDEDEAATETPAEAATEATTEAKNKEGGGASSE
jgi:pimeloyl-ACP methyl ester carboxylesterase